VALFLITPRAGRILQRHAACTPRQTQDQAMGRLHEEGARTTTPMPETEAYRAHEQARESASGSGGSVLGSHEEEVRERYTRLHGRWRCPVERRMDLHTHPTWTLRAAASFGSRLVGGTIDDHA
jgi:hypothetical protein